MPKNEKAQLYHQLLNTDRWLILERMKMLGFWPEEEAMPEESQAVQEKRGELEKALAQLRATGSVISNPQKALVKERERRWQESKQRRAKVKAEKQTQLKQRHEHWLTQKTTRLYHVGEGYSAGLENKKSDAQRLQSSQLPVIHNAQQLAQLMGITIAKLRWLTYHRKAVTLVHYHRYEIAKKSGGLRHISAPKQSLALAQQWIFEEILKKIPVHACAHGFVENKSIVSNALPHCRKSVVINLDLENFFPTIGFRRVKGLYTAMGYSEALATVLALLCTEPPRISTELDGKTYYVALGERVLPQGACTSPAISNLICRHLDRRLVGFATQQKLSYSRYADDLTFSLGAVMNLGAVLTFIRQVITEEGFIENKSKTRIMHQGRRQEVTGLTVNDKLAVARKDRRQLRAILYNVAKNGLAAENRQHHPNFAAYLRGKVAYFKMVDPDQPWETLLSQALKK